MAKIYNDGTDQYVLFRATATDYTAFTGTNDGDPLPSAIIVFSEYKKEHVSLESPTITWDSTVGAWKAVIPAESVTQDGQAWITISATDMIPVSIELSVSSISEYPTVAEITQGIFGNNYRSGRTLTDLYKLMEIMLLGTVSGLTNGTGTNITFTGADGSYIIFSVDANGNRVFSSYSLV